MEHEKKLLWAQFRFAVIAPLVCRPLSDDERREILRQIETQRFVTPDGQEKYIPRRTVSDWLLRYKKNGFDGLVTQDRNTIGSCRAIPEDVLNRAIELRKEIPSRSVRTIISILRAEKKVVSELARSTLNFQLNLHGASRERLKSDRGTFQRWEQKYANALWQADTSHGLWLPDPSNPRRQKQTKLISFIDDATRVVTHAEFYFDEKLPSLIDCFRKALLKRGKPSRLYADNAFIYHSRTMELMCAKLRIEPSFCAAYSPEGKGKVEKHFGTIKSAFFKEAEHSGLSTLEDLNKFFWAWLTKEYHHQVHSSLRLTPIARWSKDEHLVCRVTPEEIRDALLLSAQRRVNSRTATVRLENESFQAPIELAGDQVEVKWDPRDLKQVEIWNRGKFLGLAPLVVPGKNIDFNRKPATNLSLPRRGTPLASSKNYRMALVDEFENEKPVVTASPAGDYLTEQEFASIVARQLQKELDPEEIKFLQRFFYEQAPLKSSVEQMLAQAISAKGPAFHLRFYCEHIRTSLLKQRKSNT